MLSLTLTQATIDTEHNTPNPNDKHITLGGDITMTAITTMKEYRAIFELEGDGYILLVLKNYPFPLNTNAACEVPTDSNLRDAQVSYGLGDILFGTAKISTIIICTEHAPLIDELGSQLVYRDVDYAIRPMAHSDKFENKGMNTAILAEIKTASKSFFNPNILNFQNYLWTTQ